MLQSEILINHPGPVKASKRLNHKDLRIGNEEKEVN